MFDHDRGNVRVVVLHGDVAPESELTRNAGGQVPRVEVSHDRARLDAEEVAKSLEGRAEVGEALDPLEVTDVGADVRRIAAHQCERVLEVRAAGK